MAKTITYAGGILDLNGGTAVDPITCADVLAEDVSEGWGVFTNPTTDVFLCTAYFRVGNSSTTYFEMDGELLIISTTGGTFRFRPNATVTLTDSEIRLESTAGSESSPSEGALTATNCIFRVHYRWIWAGTSTLTDCYILEGYQAAWLSEGTHTWTRVNVHKLYLAGGSGTFTDCVVRDVLHAESGGAQETLRGGTVVGTTRSYNSPIDLIDLAFDDISLTVDANGGPIRERYTFASAFQDASGSALSGVAVTITDGEDTEVASYSTNANGLPDSEQLLTPRKWTYSGTPASPTLTDYNPFTVTAWKTGYEPYSAVVTIDNPQEDAITLLDYVPRTVAGIEHSVEATAHALAHTLSPDLTISHTVSV